MGRLRVPARRGAGARLGAYRFFPSLWLWAGSATQLGGEQELSSAGTGVLTPEILTLFGNLEFVTKIGIF